MLSLDVKRIVFPIFPIKPSARIFEKNNIIYAETYRGTQIVDNRNLIPRTLGERRLRLIGEQLYHLRPAIYSIQELLYYYAKKHTKIFIDSVGIMYKCVPEKFYSIKYYKILRVLPIEGSGCLLSLEGISTTIPYPSYQEAIENNYAELIRYNLGYLIKDLTLEIGNRRRVKL